jgi:osmotically-inducible protein OsmY
MEAYDGNADTFASLSAVSYPAAVKSHNLALKNGWVSSQPNYGTGNPAYAVSKGVVYLSGSMHTTGTMTLAFVLPKAARPGHILYISVYTFDGSSGFLEILKSGQVYVQGAQSNEFTSLAAVSFPVASTKWHDFKLEAGWKSDAKTYGTGSPAYAVVNGVVYLNGSMDQPTPGTGLWTNLPAAARTKTDVLEIEVYAVNGTTGSIAITNSLGLVSSMPFTNAEDFTSLAGVAYPQKS